MKLLIAFSCQAEEKIIIKHIYIINIAFCTMKALILILSLHIHIQTQEKGDVSIYLSTVV